MALSGYGKYAGLGGTVDDLLRERREEAQRNAEAHPLTMTCEQFDTRLDELDKLAISRRSTSTRHKATEEAAAVSDGVVLGKAST